MKNIQITCDRCGKVVEGTIDICPTTGVTITGGYYLVAEGNWQEYQRDDEEYICEECMHSDPNYKQLYKE